MSGLEQPLPDPSADALRAAIVGLFKHRDSTGAAKMHPARDVKLDAVLDRQGMIMHSLALILDELLVARGQARCIRFEARVDNGPGPSLVEP